VPLEVSHADQFYHDLVVRRDDGRAAHGITSWHLLPWLLLAAVCLFVMLFPLGIMNIAAIAVVTLVIFAEKTLPWTRPTSRTTAAVLVAYGALVLVAPNVLPTSMANGSMTMDTPAAPSDMSRMPMPKTAPVPAR
jgi:hypothetical protein